MDGISANEFIIGGANSINIRSALFCQN